MEYRFTYCWHHCSQIELGPKNRLSQSIPAYGYWNVQFYQMEAAYVHFDLWLPRGASLGFYARRNALPTHTNYDLMEVIKGTTTSNSERNARSIQVHSFSSANVFAHYYCDIFPPEFPRKREQGVIASPRFLLPLE